MKLINLIKNEFIKLFHYRSVVFLLIIIVLIGPSTFISISSGLKSENSIDERIFQAGSSAEHFSFESNIYQYLQSSATYKSLTDISEFKTNSKKALMELEGYDILYYYYYFKNIDNKEETDYYWTKYNELKEDINNLSIEEVLNKYKSFHEGELDKLKNYYNNVTLTSDKEFFEESIENKINLIDSYKYKKSYIKEFETNDYDYYASKILEVVLFSEYSDITRKELDQNVNSYEEKQNIYDNIQTYYNDKYYLDNHMTYTKESSSFIFTQAVDLLLSLCILVTLLFAIVDILPSEFNSRTAKQLLIRPYSRTKILASKYIVSFVYGIVITLVSMLLLVLASSIVSEFAPFDNLIFYDISTSKICVVSFLKYFMLLFISKVGFIVLLTSLLMFLEVVIKNAGITGLIVLFLLIIGLALGGDFYFNLFNPILVSDFSSVLFGGIGSTLYSSMLNSIIITIIEIILFSVSSIVIFENIDIKNN